MAVSLAVGMIGSGLHMMTSGVDLDHLARAFSSNVWGGPASPNWPVAIALASVLGFIAATGAQRDREALPRDIGLARDHGWRRMLLIVAGCGFAALPALVLVSAGLPRGGGAAAVGGAIGLLINARTERALP